MAEGGVGNTEEWIVKHHEHEKQESEKQLQPHEKCVSLDRWLEGIKLNEEQFAADNKIGKQGPKILGEIINSPNLKTKLSGCSIQGPLITKGAELDVHTFIVNRTAGQTDDTDLISLTVKHLELYNVNRYAHRRVETERCPEILQYVTTLRQTVDLKLLQSYSKNMLPANFEHDREKLGEVTMIISQTKPEDLIPYSQAYIKWETIQLNRKMPLGMTYPMWQRYWLCQSVQIVLSLSGGYLFSDGDLEYAIQVMKRAGLCFGSTVIIDLINVACVTLPCYQVKTASVDTISKDSEMIQKQGNLKIETLFKIIYKKSNRDERLIIFGPLSRRNNNSRKWFQT